MWRPPAAEVTPQNAGEQRDRRPISPGVEDFWNGWIPSQAFPHPCRRSKQTATSLLTPTIEPLRGPSAFTGTTASLLPQIVGLDASE